MPGQPLRKPTIVKSRVNGQWMLDWPISDGRTWRCFGYRTWQDAIIHCDDLYKRQRESFRLF